MLDLIILATFIWLLFNYAAMIFTIVAVIAALVVSGALVCRAHSGEEPGIRPAPRLSDDELDKRTIELLSTGKE